MASTTENNQNTNTRIGTSATPMTRFSIDEEEFDDFVPIAFKRPRFTEQASQSRVVTDEEEEDDEDYEAESDSVEYECDEEDEDNEMDGDDDGSEDDDSSDGETPEVVPEVIPEYCPPPVRMTTPSREALIRRPQPISRSVVTDSIENGELQVVLTDPDVLDCPICLDPLCSPVFQCENGHIACNLCCTKIKRKCPSCCMPIGYNRCRAIEKVIESVKIACKNARYGCKMTMNYCKKIEHEQVCPHTTCFCPHQSCPFAGSSKNLYLHFGIQHAASTTRFTYDTPFNLLVESTNKHMYLQEQHESVIFILNHEAQEHGRCFSVDCVGPSSLKTSFVYQLTAKRMEATLSLQCAPEIYAKWSENTPRKYILTVPSDFSLYNGILSIDVCIKKAQSSV